MIDYSQIPSPAYVVDEVRLRKNLSLIKSVKERSGADIILAFKAFALWKLFPIVREYIPYSTASSLSEARLAYEEMGNYAHTYSPAYTDEEFAEIASLSSHITFNSIQQYERRKAEIEGFDRHISCGIRVNPEISQVETDLYNPCAPGSRLGVTVEQFGGKLPEGIEGFHCHALCESSSYEFEKLMQAFEEKFAQFLPQLKWVNFGGGHLMTRKDYDVEHLIKIVQGFRSRYPWLKVILEPGSAFAWQTGELVSTVVDIVENHGIKTAILNVSFACHMPDCLEMPYKPAILGATDEVEGKPTYRMGGNSCLSGDFVGSWSFDHELQVGEKIVFMDMIHYTTVKTTLFNGVSHPSIVLWTQDNKMEVLRKFGYEDYKSRMD
ncbi:MAG: carboxynorspermidine decarboxylase [Paludibacteraceae bacterium]|nr:carboxynorspermidine decarboxylase [Paludibacteraceae bacterium]